MVDRGVELSYTCLNTRVLFNPHMHLAILIIRPINWFEGQELNIEWGDMDNDTSLLIIG